MRAACARYSIHLTYMLMLVCFDLLCVKCVLNVLRFCGVCFASGLPLASASLLRAPAWSSWKRTRLARTCSWPPTSEKTRLKQKHPPSPPQKAFRRHCPGRALEKTSVPLVAGADLMDLKAEWQNVTCPRSGSPPARRSGFGSAGLSCRSQRPGSGRSRAKSLRAESAPPTWQSKARHLAQPGTPLPELRKHLDISPTQLWVLSIRSTGQAAMQEKLCGMCPCLATSAASHLGRMQKGSHLLATRFWPPRPIQHGIMC